MAWRRVDQGDFGELSAMQWLAARGGKVAVPVGHNEHWDVVDAISQLDTDARDKPRDEVRIDSVRLSGGD